MSQAQKILEERLVELRKLYQEQWDLACEFEGAKTTAIAVEFSEGNIHALAVTEIRKEMFSINSALASGMVK